ncbi:endolytic transglycosylase MltG [Catenuloplanes sp. NPDC051500]|uniref:endolytic transglycosylase MltG n=1 Tax=Catenuloplanes sp. NPDC051500 TaxID=3363959 RepID=UPI0037AD1E84
MSEIQQDRWEAEPMFDDAHDERQPQKGRPLHWRGRKRGPMAVALVLVVLLVGGVGFLGFGRLKDRFTTPDYSGPGHGEAMVEVKTGASATSIGNALYKQDVVKSVKAFIVAADANPASTGIQVGFYTVKKQMKAADALEMLLDLKNRVSTKVTR